MAYMVVRNFGVKIYSSVHSILATSTKIAAVLGSVLLSAMSSHYGNHRQYLALTDVVASGQA